MAVVDLKSTCFALTLRKKLNRDLTIYPNNPKLGAGALVTLQAGVYQMRRRSYGLICVREKFYQPSDQTQPNKVLSQQKFAAGVLAWQNLTSNQKKIYNKRASGKQMSGYNLFLRNYMYA
jgi:hypothetical protein